MRSWRRGVHGCILELILLLILDDTSSARLMWNRENFHSSYVGKAFCGPLPILKSLLEVASIVIRIFASEVKFKTYL